MISGAVVFIGLVVLSILGIPIFLSLGISTVAAMILADMPLLIVPQKTFAGIDSTSLLAIPFFMIAGNIMSLSITGKLIDVSNALIGWIKGSLGLVTVCASALFGAISGSAVATLSAVGGTTIPAMKKEGYPDHFAAALSGMASILGPLIPPSITLIVYGSITDTPIAKLFMASIIPGLILFAVLMIYTLYYGKKHDLPAQQRQSIRQIVSVFRKSIWALLMPVIVLGGIFGGIFTPTEAAAVVVVYAFAISMFVYKDMNLKVFYDLLISSAVSTAAIMILVGLSKASSYVVITSGLPQSIMNSFSAMTDSSVVILLLINVVFLILGMLMEANAAIVMMTPLLMPLVTAYGVNPIQFGMIMSLNLYIGLMTPPVGISVLLGNNIAGANLTKTLKSSAPMLILSLVLLALVTYIPALTTWLPSMLSK